jgi:pseudouridine kinase
MADDSLAEGASDGFSAAHMRLLTMGVILLLVLRFSPRGLIPERATLYVNLEEAGLLCQAAFADAGVAAAGMVARGAARAVVTDGGRMAAEATRGAGLLTAAPPQVMVTRVTGAGDTFMAAHIAAESRGAGRAEALDEAIHRAAVYVSGEIGT